MGMVLAEAGLLEGAHLFGTDCRADAVAAARSALFPPDAPEGLSVERRSRHFERMGSGWRVVEAVRRHTAWRIADSTVAVPGGLWDLILCRNLVIYLEAATAEEAAPRLPATTVRSRMRETRSKARPSVAGKAHSARR
jgi:chemotaxis methyl-accepting protein methylase